MTNKSLFLIIFVFFIIGLVTASSIIYNQVINQDNNTELSVGILKENLKTADDQIRIITNENGVLRSEVDRLKIELDGLYKDLAQLDMPGKNQQRNTSRGTA